MIPMPRLTILAGHYGSGKTNLAVNLALYLRLSHRRVAVADLDIVNPYYRAQDATALLRGNDIRLFVSDFAGSNLDVPSLSAASTLIFDDPELYAVADVGGDDRGALALGRYAAKLEAHDSKQVLFVLNALRPLTATPEQALGVMGEIETAAHISFTGIVNNTNIGPDTTPEDILSSLPTACGLSALCSLPIVSTSLRRDLLPACEGKVDNLFPLDIIRKKEWVL